MINSVPSKLNSNKNKDYLPEQQDEIARQNDEARENYYHEQDELRQQEIERNEEYLREQQDEIARQNDEARENYHHEQDELRQQEIERNEEYLREQQDEIARQNDEARENYHHEQDELERQSKEVKKDTRKNNPNWDRIELILALNLYHVTFPDLPEVSSIEIKKLNSILIQYHKLIGSQITKSLRNTNGIFMKLRNFEYLDTRVPMKGLSSHSKLDVLTWNEFINNIKELNEISEKIIIAIKLENTKLLTTIKANTLGFRIDLEELNYFLDGYNIALGRTNIVCDKYTNPVLNIKNISKVFAKYIIAYNAEYTSTIIGIFAKWGRGKTFFYNQLKKDIKKENSSIYFCKFQPWKYQEKESAWAYLYENVLNNYLKYKTTPLLKNISKIENTIRNKFNTMPIINKLINGILNYIEPVKLYKIFLLNKTRLGIGKLIMGISSLLLLSIWIIMPIDWKFSSISWVIGVLGLTGTIFIYKSYSFYIKSKGTVSDLINHYGKTKDYSNHLGFQNEIEKELKYLINTYITEEKERLILFIDDLDRCDEKMIINIMDSLRLVLEDRDINKKVTIITAVDERILLKSIKHKYFNKDDILDTRDISPREYIEKFFLVALKLNHLNDKDKIELIDEYTSIFNSPFHQSQAPAVSAIEKIQNNEELTDIERAFIKEEPFKEYIKNNNIEVNKNHVSINKKEIEQEDNIILEEKKLEVLNKDEIKFIKELTLKYSIDTPRKINMMIQRYLLFKNFILEDLGHEKSDYKLYISLVFYAVKAKSFKKLIKIYDKSEDEEIEFEIGGKKFKENRDRFIILVKYAEIVSPF